MKIIIFGLGSIGNRHLDILKMYFNFTLFAFRSTRESTINKYAVRELYSWKEVEALKPDIAFITSPTSLHISIAVKCAELGIHLFIEKPLSNSLSSIDTLMQICNKKKLTCYTAYCLRFHPVIKSIYELCKEKIIYHVRVVCSSYLPHWRYGTNSKQSYSAFSSKGGGVLMDLSHEIDYIFYLFGDIISIMGVFDRVSDVTVDSEDISDLLIETKRVKHINLHLNFISKINERLLKIDLENGYIIGDLNKNTVEYELNGNKNRLVFDVKRNEYLKEQTEYFINNIGTTNIMNNLKESTQVLTKILEFKNGR